MKEIKLLLSSDALHNLHAKADGKGSVKVDRETLRHLIIDYGRVTAALSSTVKVVEPRLRPRLRE